MVGTFISKMLHHLKYAARALPNQYSSSCLLSVRCISNTANQDSFTVSYLINSCGFSPESALSISKRVNFKTTKKPDSVIQFLKNHDFSQTQISDLIRKAPVLLVSNPDKTLLPKFDFFYSKDVSSPDLAQFLSVNPNIMRRSLENHIIPTFNFLKKFMHSNEKTFEAIKRFFHVIHFNVEDYLVPNVNILRDNGVPESNIALLLRLHPGTCISKSEKFKRTVEEVREMGINPLRSQFIQAVSVVNRTRKSTWERKVNIYKGWGFSEEDVIAAFVRFPKLMFVSEDKIMAKMDFFVNKLGWGSSVIVKRPVVLSLSLENRIFRRASVLQYLLSKHLVKKNFSEIQLFQCPEMLFLQRYVNCYKEDAPQLLKLYKKEVGTFKITR